MLNSVKPRARITVNMPYRSTRARFAVDWMWKALKTFTYTFSSFMDAFPVRGNKASWTNMLQDFMVQNPQHADVNMMGHQLNVEQRKVRARRNRKNGNGTIVNNTFEGTWNGCAFLRSTVSNPSFSPAPRSFKYNEILPPENKEMEYKSSNILEETHYTEEFEVGFCAPNIFVAVLPVC